MSLYQICYEQFLIAIRSYWPLQQSPLFNMEPEHHYDDEYSHYESLDQWDSVCRYCFRTISSSRPPVLNPDNCSCAEAGTFASGSAELPASQAHKLKGIQENRELYYQTPQSTTSSDDSVPCPEGPEREEPKLHVSHTFLPLVPDIGLNEAQHCRSASFHSDMSYQMRQFLLEREPHLLMETSQSRPGFLSQDIHIQAQLIKEPKNRSKPSYQSVSSGSGEASIYSWGADPVFAVGAQFNGGGSVFQGQYPLTISGMSGYQREG